MLFSWFSLWSERKAISDEDCRRSKCRQGRMALASGHDSPHNSSRFYRPILWSNLDFRDSCIDGCSLRCSVSTFQIQTTIARDRWEIGYKTKWCTVDVLDLGLPQQPLNEGLIRDGNQIKQFIASCDVIELIRWMVVCVIVLAMKLTPPNTDSKYMEHGTHSFVFYICENELFKNLAKGFLVIPSGIEEGRQSLLNLEEE